MSEINFKDLKILVIDDDEFICATVGNTMRKLGCAVFVAGNGNEGLAIFKIEKPDLVVTDLLMPEKEGLETIKDMRLLNPHVKIIAMSGGGATQNMTFLRMAEKVGASCTMVKPIIPAQLISAVRGLLAI